MSERDKNEISALKLEIEKLRDLIWLMRFKEKRPTWQSIKDRLNKGASFGEALGNPHMRGYEIQDRLSYITLPPTLG